MKKIISILTAVGLVACFLRVAAHTIQRSFVFVTKKNAELSETAKAFFDFAASKAADDLIAKAGAAYHNAEILLESIVGKGSSVTISFNK